MISFIIPAYNCDAYIRQCIESILFQGDPDFEVIIIDDGSNDGTSAIIEEYVKKDSRVRFFHVENGGPARARNIGLDNAIGDWVIFVDADDWVDLDFLAKLDLRNKNNIPDIIFWGFKRCYENSHVEVCAPKDYHVATDKMFISAQLVYLLESDDEFFGYSVNKIYKRSIIEEANIRFCKGLSFREDELFALQYCSHITSSMILSQVPYNYRIIDSSLSHDVAIKFRNHFLLASKECAILSLFEHTTFHEALARRIFKYYLAAITECLYLKRCELMTVIRESLSFYDKYNSCLILPLWQKIIMTFPIKTLRDKLIVLLFKIRLKLKF